MNHVDQLHENDRFQELFDGLFDTDSVSDLTYGSGANHTGYLMQLNNVARCQTSSKTEGRRSSLPGEYDRGLDYVSRDTTAAASEYFIDPRLLSIEPSMLHTQTPASLSSAVPNNALMAEDSNYNHRTERICNEDENVLNNQFCNHPLSSQLSQSKVENNLMLHGVAECHSTFDVTLNDCADDSTTPNLALDNCPPIYYCPQPGCRFAISYFPLTRAELDEHNAEDHPMSAVQVNLGGESSTLPFTNEHSMFELCPQPGCQSNIENVPFTREELDEHMTQYHSPLALGFSPDHENNNQSLRNEPPIFDSTLEENNLALLGQGGATPDDNPSSTEENPHPEHPFVATSVAGPSLEENNLSTLNQTDVTSNDGFFPEDDHAAMFSQDDSDDDLDSIEENPVPKPALVIPEPDAQGRIRCTAGGCSNKTGFVKEGTYRTHMRKHHDGPDEQPEKKVRKTKADLVPAEDASKTMEDGKLTWRCKLPGCDHKSSSKNSFTRHYLSKHVAANRDHCPLCNWSPDDKVKDFGRADSVQKHISRFHAQVSKNDPKIKRTLDKLRRSNGERNVWDHSNEPAGKGFEGRDEDGLLPEEKISGCLKKRRRVTGESKSKPKKPKNVAGPLDRDSQASGGSSYEEADSDDERPGDYTEVSNNISTRKNSSLNLRKHNRDPTNATDLQLKKRAKTSHEATSGDTNSSRQTESTQASPDETNYSVPSNTSTPTTEHETVDQNTEMSGETVVGGTAHVNHYNALTTSVLQQLEQEHHDLDDSFGNYNSSLEQTLLQHRAANSQVSETSSMNQNSFHHGSHYQFAGRLYTPSTISTNNNESQSPLNATPRTEELNQNQVLTDPYRHSNGATFGHPAGGIGRNTENIPAYIENTQRRLTDDEELMAIIKEAIRSEGLNRDYNQSKEIGPTHHLTN